MHKAENIDPQKEIKEINSLLSNLKKCGAIAPHVYEAVKYILKARIENIKEE